jgi:hypothetical protein
MLNLLSTSSRKAFTEISATAVERAVSGEIKGRLKANKNNRKDKKAEPNEAKATFVGLTLNSERKNPTLLVRGLKTRVILSSICHSLF